MQLDDRARAAAAALQHAVPDIPQPYRPRSPRRGPLFAVAVLIVLALIGGAAVLRRDDSGTNVSSHVAHVPRFVVDPVPAGLTATGAADLPQASAPDPTADIAVYAASPAGPTFAVLMVVRGAPDQGVNDTPDRVQVQGHDAYIVQTDARFQIVWQPTSTVRVVLGGRGIDRDALVAAAQTVDLATVTVGQPPLQLPMAARVTNVAFQGGVIAPVGAVGHGVGYQDGVSRSLIIATVEGDEALMTVLRYFALDNSRSVVVRGHDAWMGSPSSSTSALTVVWQEAPGVVAMVQANDMAEAEVLDALAHLREATDGEWKALEALSSSSSATASATSSSVAIAAPIGARATKQGTVGSATYLAWIDESGNPGITIASPAGTVSSASASSLEQSFDTAVARFAVVDGRYGIVYGRVPSTVARTRFELDSGDTSETTPNQLTGESFALLDAPIEVAEGNLAEGRTGTLILFDGQGNELGRLSVTAGRV